MKVRQVTEFKEIPAEDVDYIEYCFREVVSEYLKNIIVNNKRGK